jgi:hypothetical protein
MLDEVGSVTGAAVPLEAAGGLMGSRSKGGNLLIDPATTSNEHYTPWEYAEASREVMGCIDLDPASCREANRVIQANVWNGPENGTDGLQVAKANGWHGNVFLNPPGGYMLENGKRVSCVPRWWRALMQQRQLGNVTEAIFLAFNMNVFRTAQAFDDVPPPHLFPFCVPSDRICFDRLNEAGERVPGKQPPQDSAIIYIPPSGLTRRDIAVARFLSVFSRFGVVRV